MAHPETVPRATSSGRAPGLPKKEVFRSSGDLARVRSVKPRAATDRTATTTRALTRWSIPFRAAALPERVRALVRMQAAPQFQSRAKSEENEKEVEEVEELEVEVEATAAAASVALLLPPLPPLRSSVSLSMLASEKEKPCAFRGARSSSFDIETAKQLGERRSEASKKFVKLRRRVREL